MSLPYPDPGPSKVPGNEGPNLIHTFMFPILFIFETLLRSSMASHKKEKRCHKSEEYRFFIPDFQQRAEYEFYKTKEALCSNSYVKLSQYWDQHFWHDSEEQEKLLKKSCTLYVGNLSFYTTEEQIYELFSKSGNIKKIIMGLDKMKKTAYGFCFVEYHSRADAENAVQYINGMYLDDRITCTDWDAGLKEGRQYGRGHSGGQMLDEYRQDYDLGEEAMENWPKPLTLRKPRVCITGNLNYSKGKTDAVSRKWGGNIRRYSYGTIQCFLAPTLSYSDIDWS
ncbi:hypothetical protein EI555_007596 [Monodon monoceros]|uniref:Nuclear cap-binding protein subunit 2 n=1 Tax=Monodon monoceros TaxID=40151 RepID=A0A4V5PA82_MONMO|nr:hypothetical protein EI555_007596 [Monodon monoceros]